MRVLPSPFQVCADEMAARVTAEVTFLPHTTVGVATWSESPTIKESWSQAGPGRLDGGSGWLQRQVTEAQGHQRNVHVGLTHTFSVKWMS